MFTSKKAQYLNKNFDRISPIINIDSLYYEQVEKDGDTSYIIKRRAVAKYMPIKFDISNFLTSPIDVSNSSNPITGEVSLGPVFKNISTNINYIKSEILNPSDSITHELLYNTSLYTIDSSKNINIQDLLQYYTNVHYFNTSINNIVNQINTINTSIQNISNYIVDTSLALDSLINTLSSHTEYYTWNNLDASTTLENNGIYNLFYHPNESHSGQYIANASFIIKVQNVYINNTKHLISLDAAQKNYNIKELNVDNWVFHYDFDSSTITYLKDEYGNEGNFDFRIHKLKEPNRNIFYSALADANNCKNNIIYLSPEQQSNLYIAISCSSANNNQIFNSNKIIIESDSQQYSPANNIINNSYEVIIQNNSQNNKIFNSSNYKCDVSGNNNTIINCNDCSIYIVGNNNVLINLKNQTLNLGGNNTIMGDEVGCQSNTSLENMKLFFDYSTSTALATGHTSSCTFYGGFGNDVSVYVGGLKTTNKY